MTVKLFACVRLVGLKVALSEIMNDDKHWYTMISHLTHESNEATFLRQSCKKKKVAWSDSRIPPPPQTHLSDFDDLRQF